MEEMHGLRHQLTEKFNFYWNAFEQARKNYQENNAERKAAFEELKEKDDKSAQEIDFQMRKLQRISVRIMISVTLPQPWLNILIYLSTICNYFCRKILHNLNLKWHQMRRKMNKGTDP